MQKFKTIAALAASVSLILGFPENALAQGLEPRPGMTEERQFVWGPAQESGSPFVCRDRSGYTISNTSGATDREAYYKAFEVLDQYFPAVNLSLLPQLISYKNRDGTVSAGISAEGVRLVTEYQRETDAWIAENLPAIVPEGTNALEAIQICAAWIAAHTEYDTVNPEENSNQTALRVLRDGTGVCAGYTSAFNALVRRLPVNAATGTIDYSGTSSAVFYSTRFVQNEIHAWSAVLIEGVWHYYDVCWFDALGGDWRYLDMDESLLCDESHQGVITSF